MLMPPGETALPFARYCFGGRYGDSPRNDVVGEWCYRLGTVVPSVRDCFGGRYGDSPRNDVRGGGVGVTRFAMRVEGI